MYNIEWRPYDPEQTPKLLAEITPKLDGLDFDPNTTIVEKYDLPFYAEYVLLKLEDSNNDLEKKVLYSPSGDAHVLNWTNEPIYSTNEKAPIHITEETAKEYVKFFFDHVRGRHGRFLIVENPKEIDWKEEPPEKGLKALEKMITGLSKIDQKDDGTLTFASYMVFKDSLFKANVHVEKDGMVSLSDEQLVVEGMPINEDPAPGENFAD